MSESKEQSGSKTPKNKFYYSTYSSDIYSEAQHTAQDTAQRKEASGKHVQDKKRHWSLNVIFNVRMLIIIASVVLTSVFISNMNNKDPKSERFQILKIIAPPSVFDIKELQVPSVGSVVNKRVIFDNLINNLKSKKLSAKFSSDNNFHDNFTIKKGSKDFETPHSVQLSVITKKPEAAKQWMNGFLVFASNQTIADVLKTIERRIDDRKDKVTLEIDKIYKESENTNKETLDKIKRYMNAVKIAKRKGIVNTINVGSIPEKDRAGDLLYLQGYWKLEAEVAKLSSLADTKLVDVSDQQNALKTLENLFPNSNSVKTFYVEADLGSKNLDKSDGKQLVWSVLGGILGLILGMIISYPFRRKKVI